MAASNNRGRLRMRPLLGWTEYGLVLVSVIRDWRVKPDLPVLRASPTLTTQARQAAAAGETRSPFHIVAGEGRRAANLADLRRVLRMERVPRLHAAWRRLPA